MSQPFENLDGDHRNNCVSSDERLIHLSKKDPEAFGILYDRHYKAVCNYIYHRTLNGTLAEDLTSNTFYSAFRHINRFKWKRIPFRAWLFRIASNEIRMYFRKHGQQTDISFQTERGNELGLISGLCIPTPLPDEEIITSERQRWIHQAILELNPDYQTVIALRFFEEKKIKEISMVTGRSEGTVRSQLYRAMEQLKTILANHKLRELNEVKRNG